MFVTDRTDLIESACAHIAASRHGQLGLAVYFDAASGDYWMVDDDDLAELGAALVVGSATDTYSRWCAASSAAEVDLAAIAGDCGIDAESDLDVVAAQAALSGDRPAQMACLYLQDELLEAAGVE